MYMTKRYFSNNIYYEWVAFWCKVMQERCTILRVIIGKSKDRVCENLMLF